MKVCVIGAGASGLMCAGIIRSKGHEVTIFDGNEKAGKKLFITGKGRCNFTNASIGEEFLHNIIRGEKFLLSCLSAWNCFDTISFFENLGLKSKIERGKRVFPNSDKSSDVIKALLKHCEGVEIKTNEKVVSVSKTNKFYVCTNKGKYFFGRLIIATGGKSYSDTGSRGDGYFFAKEFGHNIIELKPALVPIELKDKFVAKLQGLSLKNVNLMCRCNGKTIGEFGEMMFTDKGITGPIVLTLSSKVNRYDNLKLSLDFKPALSHQVLNDRLLRDFEGSKNKNISSVIKGLLPIRFVEIFLEKCEIDPDKKVNSITSKERERIILKLKEFPLEFKCFYPLNCAIITSGGVDLKEINPKTMESKIVKDLYFIGEVLDIDALTGGFNLQIAFSTAFACGQNF